MLSLSLYGCAPAADQDARWGYFYVPEEVHSRVDGAGQARPDHAARPAGELQHIYNQGIQQ